MESRGEHASKNSRLRNALHIKLREASPRMRVINVAAFVVALALVIVTLVVMQSVLRERSRSDTINEAYKTCQRAADDLQETSDYLTSQARLYVTTADPTHLSNYLDEINVRDRRGVALAELHDHATSDAAVEALEGARAYSDELAQIELYALRLTAEATEMSPMPADLLLVELSHADETATAPAKRNRAHDLMYGDDYTKHKLDIRDQVTACSTLLVDTLRISLDESTARVATLIGAMHVSVISLLLVVVFVIASTSVFLLMPIAQHETSIRNNSSLVPSGALELRHLTEVYNEMYAENHSRTESLSYEADHDALTGLLNRGAFDELLTVHKHDSALLLVDVDLFKHFNDDFGHDMGDAILVEVAATLFGSFRSSDHICRIGGDEFAVIATGMDSSMRDVITQKVQATADFLRDTSNGLPAVTISVGIAFGHYGCADEDLFQRADKALYTVKQRGRNGFAFEDEV